MPNQTQTIMNSSRTNLILCLSAGLCLGGAGSAAAAAVTFVDTAPGTGWTSTKITDSSGTGSSPGSGSFTVNNHAFGGNAGAYRSVRITSSSASPSPEVGVASLPDTSTLQFCWYPSAQGSVALIDYCYDARIISSGLGGQTPAYTMVIQQGGNNFRPTEELVFSTEWTGYSRFGLTSNDFSLIQYGTHVRDSTSHPDFSAGAPTLIFGYWTGDDPGDPTTYPTFQVWGALDNFRVTVHSGIPEPSAAMLGLSAAGVLMRRRRVSL